MNTIIYTGKDSATSFRLLAVVQSVLSADEFKTFQTPSDIAESLAKSYRHPKFVVLLATDLEELSNILKMKMLLIDRKTILILPNDHKKTHLKGHQLLPSFTCTIDSDFEDLKEVLAKLTKQYNQLTGPRSI